MFQERQGKQIKRAGGASAPCAASGHLRANVTGMAGGGLSSSASIMGLTSPAVFDPAFYIQCTQGSPVGSRPTSNPQKMSAACGNVADVNNKPDHAASRPARCLRDALSLWALHDACPVQVQGPSLKAGYGDTGGPGLDLPSTAATGALRSTSDTGWLPPLLNPPASFFWVDGG